MSAFGTLLLALSALLVCCGGQAAVSNAPQSTTPTSPPSSDATPASPAFDGTLEVTELVREGRVALLTAVRTESHSGFDRVTLTLEGPDRPGYHVSYIDAPAHDCGAGDEKPIAGTALLEVRLYPTNAHTEAGQPTIRFRERSFDHPALVELERTCDFEAVTTYVLGLRARTPYRITEPSNSPDLVIDVAHPPSDATATANPTPSMP